MKKAYFTPKMDLLVLTTDDIITTSDEFNYFYDETEQEHVYDVGGWFK